MPVSTRSIDSLRDVVGTVATSYRGSTPSVTTKVVKAGITGSLTSQGNPYPYVTGSTFVLDRVTKYPWIVSGSRTNFWTRWDYQSYPIDSGNTIQTISANISTSLESVLASTNPSAPIVDLPLFVYELRELPQLVYLRGRSLLQKAASANLSYQFGWKPLLSDLGKLLDFQSAVDRRVAHLSRMYKNGGSSFKRNAGTGSGMSSPYNVTVETAVYKSQTRMESKAWYSVRWVPSYNPRDGIPSPAETYQRAFRSAMGLTFDASLVWNALPWSWLIDWFGTVGDFLQAKRNIVGFVPGQCFLMEHQQSVMTHQVVTPPPTGLTIIPPILRREVKMRHGVYPSPFSAQASLLNARQLGILASLAILRR